MIPSRQNKPISRHQDGEENGDKNYDPRTQDARGAGNGVRSIRLELRSVFNFRSWHGMGFKPVESWVIRISQ